MDGDLKDCDATVEVAPCSGAGPSVWVYPTPRPGATAPVYTCDGTIVGYAPNQSRTAITVSPTVPCATVTDTEAGRNTQSTPDEPAAPSGSHAA